MIRWPWRKPKPSPDADVLGLGTFDEGQGDASGAFADSNVSTARGTPAAGKGEFHVDTHGSGHLGLAMGLHWTALAAAGVDPIAIARRAKATHAATVTGAVAHGRRKTKFAAAKVVPAASVIATHFGSTGIVCISLGRGLFWVATIEAGRPGGHDEVLGGTELEARERAMQLVREADGRGDSCWFLTDVASLDGSEYFDIDALRRVAVQVQNVGELRPLPAATASIPKPLSWLVLIGAVWYAATLAWDFLAPKVRTWLNPPVVSAPPQEDVAKLWRVAFESWLAQQGAQGDVSTRQLLHVREALTEIPAEVGGWRLKEAACIAAPMGKPGARDWSCTAQYLRLAGGLLTADILKRLPQDWAVTATGMDGVAAAWRVSAAPAEPLSLSLHSVGHHMVHTISTLQRVQPALSAATGLKFQPISIEAPKAMDGKPIPLDAAPDALKQLQASSVVLTGPMRSMDFALSELALPVEWRELRLAVDPGATPAIRASRLVAEAKGVLYAKN